MSIPAKLIIDVQKAIHDPSWGNDRNNPNGEVNTYRLGQSGAEFKNEVLPREGQWVIEKHTNSAFIGTNLGRELRAEGINQVVIPKSSRTRLRLQREWPVIWPSRLLWSPTPQQLAAVATSQLVALVR